MMRLCLALSLWWATLSTVTHAWSPSVTSFISTTTSSTNNRKTRLVLHSTSTTTTSADTLPTFQLFNSKSRQKEALQTIQKGSVKMYTCGPTVYDSAHVGNFRAFLTYDVLKRALQYFGWEVDHICNLTDVDDKIIQRCERDGVDVETLTNQCTQDFRTDLESLNIVPARAYPRATQHIPDMVELIQLLEQNGLAYQTKDSSWYFATQQQEGYGTHLVNLQVDEMQSQERTSATDDSGKQHWQDFCLWKAYKEGVDRDDATWDTPIGRGRPGWHLECSAMSRVYLGDTIDVHCGGIDLKFPHHENEIAQSEGATGKPFCNCWVHNGFVNIGNEKMSKSMGNFLTLRQACPKPDDVRAYRYLVVSSQYRNPLSFTEQAMDGAKKSLKRIDKVRDSIQAALQDTTTTTASLSVLATETVPAQLANFETALLDDLSMPRAAASLFALVKAAEAEFKTDTPDVAGLAAIDDALQQMDKVFGIFYQVPMTEEEQAQQEESTVVPETVLELVGQRTVAKEAKDWELADSLRARITELGFAVKDVKGGEPEISRLE